MRLVLFLVSWAVIVLPAYANQGSSIYKVTRVERGLSSNKPHNFNVVDDEVRRGKKSQRFELRHGNCRGTKEWNDCINDRQRVERKEHPKNMIQRVGQKVWYGWSFRLAKDFKDISPANTTIAQVKMNNWGVPLWHINIRNRVLNIWFDTGGGCSVSHITDLRSKWQDVVVVADYSKKPSGSSFIMYLNGREVCSYHKPMVTNKMLSATKGQLYFKYGVYNSFVSKWLNDNKTKKVKAKPYKQSYKSSDGKIQSSDSITATPFKYDWGIKLPTQVIHYDEMRFGPSRKHVDILFHESKRIPPLD
jgi:hypothetical protein